MSIVGAFRGLGEGSGAVKVYSKTSKRTSNRLNAYNTFPKAQIMSISAPMFPDGGTTQTTLCTSHTTKIALPKGDIIAIAPVFEGAYRVNQRSAVGTNNMAPYTVGFSVELMNGTQAPLTYLSLNTGAALVAGTFQGASTAVVQPGGEVIGDWIFASEFGVSGGNSQVAQLADGTYVYRVQDATYLPRVKCALQKTNATDIVPVFDNTEYNYPYNAVIATHSSGLIADALTLINTSGLTAGLTGTNNNWGVGDSGSVFAPSYWIGMSASGHISVIWEGTSITAADQGPVFFQGGVNPANNTQRNYRKSGYPFEFAYLTSCPLLSRSMGSSALFHLQSRLAADTTWATGQTLTIARNLIYGAARFADIWVAYDTQNESSSDSYSLMLDRHTDAILATNPTIKIVSCKVPNGYVDKAGATQAYNAGLDTLWNAQLALVTEGRWAGQISVREGGDIYPTDGTQVSGTTTSLGSTTVLNDSSATWELNQWVSSYLVIAGVKQPIASNTRTSLIVSGGNAFASAIASGTAYTIEGNWSGDGTHPGRYGQGKMGAKVQAQLATIGIVIPNFGPLF